VEPPITKLCVAECFLRETRWLIKHASVDECLRAEIHARATAIGTQELIL
jgi:hypothetical protein